MEEKQHLQNLRETRIEKLNKLLAKNIEVFPNSFSFSCTCFDILKKYADLKESEVSGDKETIKGRLILKREMGKTVFAHIQDGRDKLQIYLKKDIVGEENFRLFLDYIDIGDIIGVHGEVFKTKTGEITLNVRELELLSKSLRPLPEKWHGLKDTEIRYRQRYLDLISNPQSIDVFIKRSKIVSCIRKILESKGFIEVETPIIQSSAGGAIARPFKTFHNALGQEFYLRIAPELHLKMLLVGGLEKIFELGKSFRNEGIDRFHNPEFTMVEIYQAYADYQTMIKLTEEIFLECAKTVGLEDKLVYENKKGEQKYIDITKFHKYSMSELFDKYVNQPLAKFLEADNSYSAFLDLGIDIEEQEVDEKGNIIKVKKSIKKLIDDVFSKFIQPNLIEPTFVIDYPTELSPLAKYKQTDKKITERFEFFVAEEEIANAYSELNDPLEQEKRFAEQKTPEEKMALNTEFITALEYGMPPAAGLGIGIDRLTMLLTGASSIRDVIFFPLLKVIKE